MNNIKTQIEEKLEELKESYNKKIEQADQQTTKAESNAFNSLRELINALNENKNISNAIAKDTQAKFLKEKALKEKEEAQKESYLNDDILNGFIEDALSYYKPLLEAYSNEALKGIEQLENGFSNILEDLSELEEIKRILVVEAKQENNRKLCENFISKYEKKPVIYTQKHIFVEIKNGETVQRLKRFKDALLILKAELNNQ